MEEVLGLCGNGDGPRIPLRSPTPSLVVTGLRPNEVVMVSVEGEVAHVLTIEKDGIHMLPPGQFTWCQYSGNNRLLMCFVRT